MMTLWKKERKKVDSQASDFSRPHSMAYRIVKKHEARTLSVNTTKKVI